MQSWIFLNFTWCEIEKCILNVKYAQTSSLMFAAVGLTIRRFSLWTCNIQTKSMYADQTVLYYQGNTLNKKWINQKRLNDLILYHLHLKIVVETLSANKHLDKSKQQTVVSNTLASFLSSLRETVCDILLNVCTWYIYIYNKNVIDANVVLDYHVLLETHTQKVY